MIASTCGCVVKQLKYVSQLPYHMLCSSSCKKVIFSKLLPLAGTSWDLTLFGTGRSYSSNAHNGELSYNPFGFRPKMLTLKTARISYADKRHMQTFGVGGIFKRLFKRNKYRKHILSSAGYSLHGDISMNTDILHFFKVLSLEDTFFSWFLIMELQVWLVAARLGAEGEDGKVVRDSLILAFWQDVEAKIKHLGARPINKSKQIHELNSHFQTSLVGYDEGLLSCDRTLACAVWRNVFRRETSDPYYEGGQEALESSNETNESSSKSAEDDSLINLDDLIVKPKTDPRALEAVVCYIRKQIYLLDQVPSENLLAKGTATWTKIEAIS